ncbi:hypothetical protein ACHAXA_009626 [Cyclostephanos tholiformis]|uniref:Uncharacterized protein n=1 Tax=Cyclostephanos tholiformis TaxID=382380 RepID=A0ABD3R1I4_9STRA
MLLQQGAKTYNGVKSRDAIWRRRQIPLQRTMTDSTSTSMTKSDADGPESDDNTSDYFRNDIVSNTTHLLRRLKLDIFNDGDKFSGKATTKLFRSPFEMERKMMQHNTSLPTTYYRPIDNHAKDRTNSPPMLHVSVPLELPDTVDSSSSKLKSDSYTLTRKQEKLRHYHQKNDMRTVSLVRSASESDNESDDDSVKRMESVTHTFQRNLSVTNRNSKVSAIPLSGIGVDVSVSDYNKDGEYHRSVNTPRDTSCSLTSFIGEIVGLTTPTNKSGDTKTRSPFDVIKKVLCTPYHVSTAFSAKEDYEWKSEMDDVRSADADNWSLEYGIQIESDDDESIESSSQREACLGRSTRINDGEVKSNQQPDLSQYRHYHREDFSYCETDADSSYCQPSQFTFADDDRSYAVSSVSFQRSRRFINSPFVRRLR